MTIGGQGIVAQMTAIDADHVDELLEAYKEHNDGLHETLEAFDELLSRPPGAEGGGAEAGHRRPPSATGPSGSHSTAFRCSPAPSTSWLGSRTRSRHKPDPEPVLLAIERLGGTPDEAVYVGDSPFDIGAAKAAGVFAVAVGWGGIHPDERLLAEEPDAFVHTPRSCWVSSRTLLRRPSAPRSSAG